jgi:hypothetical protein
MKLRVAIAKVLVLIPPPVEAGAAPIHHEEEDEHYCGKILNLPDRRC